MDPQRAAHGGDGVGKGGLRFGILGGAAPVNRFARKQLLRGQRHERVQRQQAGRGARNGLVRPLRLGLDAQMGARFFKSIPPASAAQSTPG